MLEIRIKHQELDVLIVAKDGSVEVVNQNQCANGQSSKLKVENAGPKTLVTIPPAEAFKKDAFETDKPEIETEDYKTIFAKLNEFLVEYKLAKSMVADFLGIKRYSFATYMRGQFYPKDSRDKKTICDFYAELMNGKYELSQFIAPPKAKHGESKNKETINNFGLEHDPWTSGNLPASVTANTFI